jgi:gluconate 2-dehydrogenase gamma chain
MKWWSILRVHIHDQTGNPMKDTDESRRALLKGVSGTLGLGWLAANWPAVAGAAEHAHQMMSAAAGPAVISHLTAAEAAIVDAATAHIIPTDDTPGAREAGVVYFIDYCLGAGCLGIGDEFRDGLKALDESARERVPDATGFAALSAARQVEILHSVERTPFFGQLHTVTIVGLLASPSYGGNRDGAGWKLIGFDDTHIYAPPFGYYDKDYPGFVPYTAETRR